MILYNHSYDSLTNQIRIVPVKVEETEKTFRAAKSELLYSHKIVHKSTLEKLCTEYGYHMVSRHPRAGYFKQAIISELNQRRQNAISEAEQCAAFIARVEKSTDKMFTSA